MSRSPIALHPHAEQAAVILGELIRRRRIQQQLTIEQAADIVGVSSKTISRIEHGTGTSTIGHVFNTAAALGVELFDAEAEDLEAMHDTLTSTDLTRSGAVA